MKIIKSLGMVLYLILIIILTVCLFTINPFKGSKIGNRTIISLSNNLKSYKKGSLLIVTKEKIKVGDNILYYDTSKGKKSLKITNVKKIINTNQTETTYVVKNNLFLSDEYVLGTDKTIKSIPFLGYIYSILISSIGYLIVVIIPITTYFIMTLRKRQNA
ncbi:unknown [Clostridium sp. CAG:451]|nr:unknown [Clostridium sp. CAG:451]